MWIKIFQTGAFQANTGDAKRFSIYDLDQIAAKYNTAHHEAPLVIGPLTDASPAFGWVESLKRDGESLLAKVKQLAPEVAEMIRQGVFKKRRISLYPDLRLKYVGFPGPRPERTMGALNNALGLNFREEEAEMSFNFSMEDDPGMELQKKTLALLNNPARYDQVGRRIDRELNFSEAFSIVQQENPDLAKRYADQLSGIKKANSSVGKIV